MDATHLIKVNTALQEQDDSSAFCRLLIVVDKHKRELLLSILIFLAAIVFGQTSQNISNKRVSIVNIWFPIKGDSVGWQSTYFLVGEKLYDGNDLTMNLGMHCLEELLNKAKPLMIKREKSDPCFQLDSAFRANNKYSAIKLIDKTILVRSIEAEVEFITPDCTPPSAGILDFLLVKPSGIILLKLNLATLNNLDKTPSWLQKQIEANKEYVESSIATCNFTVADPRLIKKPKGINLD